MGDDWPDLPVMRRVAFSLRARNAHDRGAPGAGHVSSPQAAGATARRASCATCCWWPAGAYAALLERPTPLMDARDSMPASNPAASAPGAARSATERSVMGASADLPAGAADGPAGAGHLLAGAQHARCPSSGPKRDRPVSRTEPDYFMQPFRSRPSTPAGRSGARSLGAEARHYPDTDTLEIDKARMRSVSLEGRAADHRGHRRTAP